MNDWRGSTVALESRYDFSAVQAAMQRYVDNDLLPGVSYAVFVGGNLVETRCLGFADKEHADKLTLDHIFRMFSSTKLITSLAALILFDEGKFALDDPVERYIPQFANRRVLRPDAQSITDTEPASTLMTVRHLFCHTAGLSYGIFDPGTVLFKAYVQANCRHPANNLAQTIDKLAPLPLRYNPGSDWEYSVATDVLGRLVEIWSGLNFDEFLQQRIFAPLGMKDSGFVVPASEQSRLCAAYKGADLLDPNKPGLIRIEDYPYAGAYQSGLRMMSGGGGSVSTLPDTIALLRSLLPGGKSLLKPETQKLMMQNHLPEGLCVKLASFGELKGKGHGLGGSVTLTPGRFDPPDSIGEFQWGGLAATHWWISPKRNVAALLMTQKHMAFWHPFSFEFKSLVYQATQNTSRAIHEPARLF